MNNEVIRMAGADVVTSAFDPRVEPPWHADRKAFAREAEASGRSPLSLLGLCVIARLHDIAAGRTAMLHFHGKSRSKALTISNLLLRAKHIGTRATRTRRDPKWLSLTPLPAIAPTRDGGTRVLAQCDTNRTLKQVANRRLRRHPERRTAAVRQPRLARQVRLHFVREGQHAAIKRETFPFMRSRTIEETVTTLSADAVVDEKRPKNEAGQTPAFFAARLTLAKGEIDVDGRMIHLSPGMNVTAEIKTGKRRIVDYLLSPLKQHLDESVRER